MLTSRRKFIQRAAAWALAGSIYVPVTARRSLALPVPQGQAPPASSPYIAWWKLLDGSGANATDASGNGNTLALHATPTWGTATINSVAGCGTLTFAGASSQYGIVASDTLADNLANFSVALWFKYSTAQDAVLIEKMNLPTDTIGWFYTLSATSASVQDFVFHNGSIYLNTNSTSASLNNNAWHHMAAVFSGSNTLTLYIDNAVNNNFANSGTWANGFSNTGFVTVGGDTTNGFYTGSIADIRIANVAWTSGQVSTIYNNPV